MLYVYEGSQENIMLRNLLELVDGRVGIQTQAVWALLTTPPCYFLYRDFVYLIKRGLHLTHLVCGGSCVHFLGK